MLYYISSMISIVCRLWIIHITFEVICLGLIVTEGEGDLGITSYLTDDDGNVHYGPNTRLDKKKTPVTGKKMQKRKDSVILTIPPMEKVGDKAECESGNKAQVQKKDLEGDVIEGEAVAMKALKVVEKKAQEDAIHEAEDKAAPNVSEDTAAVPGIVQE